MKELFLAFVPRFINDQIALTDNGEQYEIACSMVDVNPGERYDAMCDLKIFTPGWVGLFRVENQPIFVRLRAGRLYE